MVTYLQLPLCVGGITLMSAAQPGSLLIIHVFISRHPLIPSLAYTSILHLAILAILPTPQKCHTVCVNGTNLSTTCLTGDLPCNSHF